MSLSHVPHRRIQGILSRQILTRDVRGTVTNGAKITEISVKNLGLDLDLDLDVDLDS
jgi:hypothetical protein